MYILTAEQIREADQFTIRHTPISSIDLMENAAIKCCEWITRCFDARVPFLVMCGPGNNGGDGLAVSRLLLQKGYQVNVCILNPNKSMSPDCAINLRRFQALAPHLVVEVGSIDQFLPIAVGTILIDALFGTGLTKPVTGLSAEIIRRMNMSGNPIISIDIPSGIYSDKSSIISENEIVKASYTLTFQYLKTAFLVGENSGNFGKVEILDIGLHPAAIKHLKINQFQTDLDIVKSIFKPKWEFSHKGNFGHSLLITGGHGKVGAAILSARANLKSGAGLLTLLVPEESLSIVQVSVPEAMAQTFDLNNPKLPDLNGFNAIGIGPGLGINISSRTLVDQLLTGFSKPLVLDADALNLLAENKSWYDRMAKDTILTPHPGEFRRLVGDWKNDFDKLELQKSFAIKYGVYVILKGKNTSIACPDGQMWFNPTGNSGMAKGGSGDILTGLLTGLLSSGYSPFEACILGTWLHGYAGDLAAATLTREAMTAGDLINYLSPAWKILQ